MPIVPNRPDRCARLVIPLRLDRARRILAACEAARTCDWRDELFQDTVIVLRERVELLTAATSDDIG